MEKPDEFKNWIKQQIEDNPQEPPEAAWDKIAENLELESAWEGINQDLELDNLWNTIDKRLHVYEQLQWWEWAGDIMATAVIALLVFMPVVWQLAPTAPEIAEQKQEEATQHSATPSSISQNGQSPPSSPNVTDARNIQEIATAPGIRPAVRVSNNIQTHTPRSATSVSTPGTKKYIRDINKVAPQSFIEIQGKGLLGNLENSVAALKLPSGIGLDFLYNNKVKVLCVESMEPLTALQEDEGVVPIKDTSGPKSWRIGLGASARISWLLNEKTYHAMEESSLTTSLPAFRQSLSLLAEKHVSPRLALYTEFAALSQTGQRYREYTEGIYGTTDTRLRYSHLNVLLSYNPKGTPSLRQAHKRWLAGLSGGWLHSATLDEPLGITNITDQYEQIIAGLVVGYEYSIPLGKKIWMHYGLRGHVDLFNAYAGTTQIPAEFRYTRNTFLDFNIGLKYELGKN